jgi:dienelactone hydrolase
MLHSSYRTTSTILCLCVVYIAACAEKKGDDTRPGPWGQKDAGSDDDPISPDAAEGEPDADGSAGGDAADGGAHGPGEFPRADGGGADAAPDALVPDGMGACTVTRDTARCSSQPLVSVTERSVYWARPLQEAPTGGYPAVILYQGSFFGPSVTWGIDLTTLTPFGGYFQVALVAELLDRGFVVLQPEALAGLAWTTNSGADFQGTPDYGFVEGILEKLEAGAFGPVDTSRLFATGISSGGYMTSRMAVSYPGKFRALAIQSGSYATCLGPLCSIPKPLPKEHPPTLFLHGAADLTVGIGTARAYEAELELEGFETRFVEDSAAGHQWLQVAPAEIVDWFTKHL